MNRKVYLRAFEYSDLNLLHSVRNDNSLYHTTGGNKYFISSEYNRKWIEDKIVNNYHQLYLVICDKETNEPIGYVCATNIDYINRKAEFGGIIISKDFNSKGYATDTGYLLMDHLFEELGMNMIYAYVKSDNKASCSLANKWGFQQDGLIRSFVYKLNAFHDAYLFTLLKSDYENKKLKDSQLSEEYVG